MNDSSVRVVAIPASPHHAHGPGSSHFDQSWGGTDLSWALMQTTIVSSTTCGYESLGWYLVTGRPDVHCKSENGREYI